MKTCQAKKCIYPVFGGGYCKTHQYKRADFDRRSPIQKYYDNLKKDGCVNKDGGLIVSKLKEVIEKRRSVDDLQKWFEFHMEHSEMKCENCGADLSHYNERDWRGSQHHIIEKSKINGCPSVSCEIDNHGVLGKWCCHPQWHTSQENASKMPFFKIAKERFELFKNKISEPEQRKIPKMFL